MKMLFPVDNTDFIRLSIRDVVMTLVEAILLVILVMYLFLQNWRTTLVPAVAVPVVLLGTFGVLAAVGYSINTLTLFALVLVIGLLVDDAIVVVENVERIMREEGLPPREATLRSMKEITGALIGIGLVLTAVFLPMAFFGGSTGVIYRQFSVTIVSAMLLSIMCALVLTPALCATLLKPIERAVTPMAAAGWAVSSTASTTISSASATWYRRVLDRVLDRTKPTMLVYGVDRGRAGVLFFRLPTGFLPDEDQGFFINLITLPAGTDPAPYAWPWPSKWRTITSPHEKKNVDLVFTVAGFSPIGAGQNAGVAFVQLDGLERASRRPEQRHGDRRAAPSCNFFRIPDAQIFPLVPPSVPELGIRHGFDLEMEDRGNLGHAGLIQARNQLLGLAARDPVLAQVRPPAWTTHSSSTSTSIRRRPMRWAFPPPTSTPPCRRPGAASSSTISSTATASSASICKATRNTAWRRTI